MAYTDIDKPSDYFNTKLYTGNGGTNAITGVGFQPDWVWIKNRPDARDHQIYDSVRGATKVIGSDRTAAEATVTNGLTAFGSDGFTVGADANVNDNGDSHVAWNWLAGGSASSNSNGSITSSVSANTTAGFSVVSWTGSGSSATIGHGLGATPKFIIVKNRADNVNWFAYHPSVITVGATNKSFLTFNESGTVGTNSTATTFTSVSSTTFGVGTDNIINGSSDNMIAYLFAEKKGYSKIGSYTGNGSADGTFIYTGFRPAFLLYKNNSQADNWFLHDNRRQGYNDQNELLFGDITQAESTVDRIRFTSNGFKTLDADKGVGASGNTYVYIALAESPFVNSKGVPTNAR